MNVRVQGSMLKPTHPRTEARQVAIGLAAILLALLLLPAAQARGAQVQGGSLLFGGPALKASDTSKDEDAAPDKKEPEKAEVEIVEEEKKAKPVEATPQEEVLAVEEPEPKAEQVASTEEPRVEQHEPAEEPFAKQVEPIVKWSAIPPPPVITEAADKVATAPKQATPPVAKRDYQSFFPTPPLRLAAMKPVSRPSPASQTVDSNLQIAAVSEEPTTSPETPIQEELTLVLPAQEMLRQENPLPEMRSEELLTEQQPAPTPETPIQEEPTPLAQSNEIPFIETKRVVQETVIAKEVISLPPAPDPTTQPLDFTPAIAELSKRLQPEVKAGFDLGRSGALYAARRQFITVLRKVALAKDSLDESIVHSDALAEGLRALDEADDFVPRGEALEAELNTFAIARSHTTPIVRLSNAKRITPHQALSQYAEHASERLATAVKSEQAGSMALYGLGKTYARLSVQGDDPNAARKSAVLYRAALVAHRDNYLAANELGVYLARSGRYQQAAPFLRLAVENGEAPAAIYTNLAMVQRKIGQVGEALATEQAGNQIAAAERAEGKVSQRHGVQWVDPGAFQGAPAQPPIQPNFTQTNQPTHPTANMANADSQRKRSGWRGLVQQAKRATGWSGPDQNSAPPNQQNGYYTAGTPSMQGVTR